MGILGTVLGGIGGFLLGGPAGAMAGASLGGGVDSANAQADAAANAAGAQSSAALAGIAQQNKQFEAIQALLAPYTSAGSWAVKGQRELIGLDGGAAQQSAINALQGSPEFAALTQQGENGILANASATGGLRGGNVQAALGQFRPQLLAQLIDQQYSRLGGLTSIGQNAAAGVGNAGLSTGNNISNLLQQQGAALAGGALGQGRAQAGLSSALTNGLGVYAGMGGKFPQINGSGSGWDWTGMPGVF